MTQADRIALGYEVQVADGIVKVTIPPGDHPPLEVFVPADAQRIELDLRDARIDPHGLRPEGTAALTLIPSDTARGVRPVPAENPAEFRVSKDTTIGGAVLLTEAGASGGRLHSICSGKDDGVVMGDPNSGAGRMGPWYDGSGGGGVR